MDSFDRFPTGSVVAGKLRVLRRLGEGGMGAVYEVEHELTHHRRALKLLHAEMAQIPAVVERFLREASAAGRIGNAHIVETFDAGRLEGGEPYIVMELLTGGTLAELLEARGPLPVDVACDLLIQACDGVSAAHAAGIVHRDLKPENLFLVGAERPFLKILDFGVSKFDSDSTGVQGFTLEGSPIGTPYYMSPEQVRGERNVDARADVYALGVVFYECLTGRKPFVAETLPHLAVLIHQGQYAPASQMCPGLFAGTDLVVARAMASKPAERYGSAAEFAVAVARLRDSLGPAPLSATQIDSPVLRATAPPSVRALTPGVFTRASADVEAARPPRWGLALGAVLLALVGGVTIWWSTREPQAGDATQEALGSSGRALGSNEAPSVTPVDSRAPSLFPEPLASAPESTHSLPRAAPAASARPALHPSSTGPRSRASAHGLSEENPFK